MQGVKQRADIFLSDRAGANREGFAAAVITTGGAIRVLAEYTKDQ